MDEAHDVIHLFVNGGKDEPRSHHEDSEHDDFCGSPSLAGSESSLPAIRHRAGALYRDTTQEVAP